MVTQANDTGIVDTTVKDLPILAVNVLMRLGYTVTKSSKQLNQILAMERLDEKVGMDWWHHEYRVVLQWRKTADARGVVVSVGVSEHKGGGSQKDCQKRCGCIILELQNDAKRAQEISLEHEPETSYGVARWGTEQELQQAGYFQQHADPKGFIIGRTKNGEYWQVPELLTYHHAIVCGRTGVGKSTGFFIPQLIERTGTNMIVTEATPGEERGELYRLTSGWRKMAGHAIFTFNPSDMSSDRINPIDAVKWAPQQRKAKVAERLADLVILNGQQEAGKLDPTWDRSEKLLLLPLILHAAATEPKYGHFGAIRWLLLSGITKLKQVIKSSPSEVAKMEFEGWLQLTGENFRFGVMSGLLTKLNPWITDQIVALTETTDIDMDILKHQLFTFYLAVPSRSHDSKLIGSLMVNFLLDHVLAIREQMVHPITILLDEFTNFGKIKGIETVLSDIRKAKVGLILGFQNYNQLEMVYSRKEAQVIIAQPGTQVYFKQKNYREAKELSDALGRTTVEDITVTDAGRVQEFVRGRAVATPDELINLNGHVIVFTPDTCPLKLPLTSPTAYNHATAYDPPKRQEHEISEFIARRGHEAGVHGQEPTKQNPEQRKTHPEEPYKTDRDSRSKQVPPGDDRPKKPDDDRPPDLSDTWRVQ